MNKEDTGAQRSSAAWLRDLTYVGEVRAVAIAELGSLLNRAALYTLSRTTAPGTTLARARVVQIAEACAQESLRVILDRLPEFRPEGQFTTWAYKFAVKCALAAAHGARSETMRAPEACHRAAIHAEARTGAKRGREGE